MHRYIGDGAYLPGVPARDLTDLEWGELSADERKLALKLKIYEPVTPDRKGASNERISS